MVDNRIYFIDVTNRDGVQTSRICLSKLQKTLINLKLNELGVYQSEMGFPVTKHETNYINANLDLADKAVLHPMILEGWIRAISTDVATATEMTKVEHLNGSKAEDATKSWAAWRYPSMASGDRLCRNSRSFPKS